MFRDLRDRAEPDVKVIIGIWCATAAQSCVEWLQRMLYVGGDTDTVGAVAGAFGHGVCCERNCWNKDHERSL